MIGLDSDALAKQIAREELRPDVSEGLFGRLPERRKAGFGLTRGPVVPILSSRREVKTEERGVCLRTPSRTRHIGTSWGKWSFAKNSHTQRNGSADNRLGTR
jgi:hypothetical protein